MMYSLRSLFLLSVVLAVALSHHVTFDDLDIDKVLSNESKRKAAFACFLDEEPCEDKQELKNVITNMIKTNCSQCTPKQKEKFEYMSKVLQEKYPETFNAIALKYSPKAHKE